MQLVAGSELVEGPKLEEGSKLWLALRARSELSIEEFAQILAGYPPYGDPFAEAREDWQAIRAFEEAMKEGLTWDTEPAIEDIPF